jgi:hypothetical protein
MTEKKQQVVAQNSDSPDLHVRIRGTGNAVIEIYQDQFSPTEVGNSRDKELLFQVLSNFLPHGYLDDLLAQHISDSIEREISQKVLEMNKKNETAYVAHNPKLGIAIFNEKELKEYLSLSKEEKQEIENALSLQAFSEAGGLSNFGIMEEPGEEPEEDVHNDLDEEDLD